VTVIDVGYELTRVHMLRFTRHYRYTVLFKWDWWFLYYTLFQNPNWLEYKPAKNYQNKA